MMKRRKAGMLTVIGLSAALMTGMATNAVESSKEPATQGHISAAPTSDQIAETMAKQLGLSSATRDKLSKLFSTDGKQIQNLQMKLNEKRRELNALNPTAKGYMKKVDTLADQSADLTKQLTIKYAKSRAELYSLLTPKQIEKLEHGGRPKATAK